MEKEKIKGEDLIKAAKISEVFYGKKGSFRFGRRVSKDLDEHVDQLVKYADEWLKELKRIKESRNFEKIKKSRN